MEITIDLAAVRKAIAQEHAQAHTEIGALGVHVAYQRSQQRHDAKLAAAGDAARLACRQGCSWCCYFPVDVRAVEVFRILAFMQQEFTREQQQGVRQEIEANSRALRGLDELERARRNVKCPFLAAGRCTIYAARPQTCRNYHATDASGCRQSFEEPDNVDIDPQFAPLFYQAGSAHVDAFSMAMRDAGYDIAAYELNAALALALAQPAGAQQRFAQQQQPFPAIDGYEVPFELADE